jgi:hypothetical protein
MRARMLFLLWACLLVLPGNVWSSDSGYHVTKNLGGHPDPANEGHLKSGQRKIHCCDRDLPVSSIPLPARRDCNANSYKKKRGTDDNDGSAKPGHQRGLFARTPLAGFWVTTVGRFSGDH